MNKMTAKQKKELRKLFSQISKDLEESDTWTIDIENDHRELTIPELIDKDLIKDGYCHYEVTGGTTVTISYQNKKKRRVV